jgi:hypothetical protein
MVATTHYAREHPFFFWSFAVAVVTSSGMRVALERRSRRTQVFRPGTRNTQFAVAVGLPSAAAGLLHASALWFYGFESWPYVITMLWIVGCASGSTISLTPSFELL